MFDQASFVSITLDVSFISYKGRKENFGYLEPGFSGRCECEFEPACDPHGRRFFRGCLIERSEFRSSNGSFTYN